MSVRPQALLLPDGSRFELRESLIIGRDPSCQVVLPSPEVSRHHVVIEVHHDHVVLTDNSANGTYVGDQLVRRTSVQLVGGTQLTVGPYVLYTVGAEVAPRRADPTGTQRSAPQATGTRSSAGVAAVSAAGASAEVRRRVHRMLLDHLDLVNMDRERMDEGQMRPKVADALRRILADLDENLGTPQQVDRFVAEMCDEALGLGPLEQLLADPEVSEIMVVSPTAIFVERRGKIEHTNLRFTDDEAARAVIERIVTPLGRRIDESTPLVDARLKDGSRVNAVIKPLALRGACITIRRFPEKALPLEDLVAAGALTEQMGRFLMRSVVVRRNIVISGGTGSGKTTLLNLLSRAIPEDERVITIEDAAELRLEQTHVVSLESKPPNLEGKGEISIRDLVKNALRMRPDRIVVGECRGGEALDMLQAMNTGHEGSMTTTHANSPREAVARLETLALMSGLDLPVRAIREQIAHSVNLVVQTSRLSDGSRKVTSIAEVTGIDENEEIQMREIFRFVRSGTDGKGRVLGKHQATGYLPGYLDLFIKHGLVRDGVYL